MCITVKKKKKNFFKFYQNFYILGGQSWEGLSTTQNKYLDFSGNEKIVYQINENKHILIL